MINPIIKRTANLLAILFLSFTSYGQINVKDSVQNILKNDTVDALTRFNTACGLIQFNSSPEEAELLGMNVMYPFAQKIWRNKSDQLSRLAQIYLTIYTCHRERGGDDSKEKERLFLEKAIEAAEKSGDNLMCARSWNALAYMEIQRGNAVRGIEYLYQAKIYFDKMEMYVRSAETLYVIAGRFFDIKDVEGMERVLRQMEDYFEKDNSKQSLYQYNLIKHNYFEVVLAEKKKKNGATDHRLVDSLIWYVRKNIDLAENHLDELSRYWMHGYAYYFMARALDNNRPEQNDSILLYLDKALDMLELEWFSRTNEANAAKEMQAGIGIIRAKALSRKRKWQEAYKTMTGVLPLIEESKHYRKQVDSEYAAYQFMADYYEKFNNPVQALNFQKLLRESEALRYENEKVQVLNEMSIKYETEKKEIQIQTLAKEKKADRRIFIGLTITLFVISVLIILSNRLKRKNVEQRLYETALLAELHQNEIEKIKNSQLQSDKQQLEHYRVQNTIESIVQIVSDSIIENDRKKTYLERLSKLDPKLFESIYQNTNVKITGMDMKYIVCFAADIDGKDVSLIFNVEPASVNTVRYRIRKKYAKIDTLLTFL